MTPPPFSLDNKYTLIWQVVPPDWRAEPDALLSLTERDGEILQTLATLRLATSLQLLKPFYPTNLKTAGKERLKKLYGRGAVVLHRLENRERKIGLVTLGPLGARLTNTEFEYDPGWHRTLDVAGVLRHLVTVQLYFRLREIVPVRFLPAPAPYTAVLAIRESRAEFTVLALRRGDAVPAVGDWNRPPRLIVIAEDEGQMQAVARVLTCPARYTTDAALMNEPLHLVFWRPKDGRLERDEVQAFAPAGRAAGAAG